MAHWPLNWNVVRHDLVVGSCPRTPSDLDALRVETRVSAVLSLQHDDCLEKQEIDYPGLVRHGRRLGLTMARWPLRDFDPADQQRGLPAAVRGLWDLLRQGHRVYVHCTAGINRSPLVVLAYLTLVEGMSLEEAITLLLHARPEVCPTWEAYHGCRQELTARYEDRIRQRAFECSLRQPESSTLDHWLQAERAIWREVLTAGSSRARPCCKPLAFVEHSPSGFPARLTDVHRRQFPPRPAVRSLPGLFRPVGSPAAEDRPGRGTAGPGRGASRPGRPDPHADSPGAEGLHRRTGLPEGAGGIPDLIFFLAGLLDSPNLSLHRGRYRRLEV